MMIPYIAFHDNMTMTKGRNSNFDINNSEIEREPINRGVETRWIKL